MTLTQALLLYEAALVNNKLENPVVEITLAFMVDTKDEKASVIDIDNVGIVILYDILIPELLLASSSKYLLRCEADAAILVETLTMLTSDKLVSLEPTTSTTV